MPTVFVSEAPALRFVIALLAASAGACSASRPLASPVVKAEPAPQTAAKHPIEGLWRLVQFDSRDPLDPPLEGFVAGELGHLEVWLSPTRLYANGELVDTVCDYHIDEFDGRKFALTLTSEGTTWSTVSGRLEKDEIFFDALDAPWVGSGRFTRQGP